MERVALATKQRVLQGFLVYDPGSLPESLKQGILDDFCPVAQSAFEVDLSEAFRQDVAEHLFGAQGLVLAYDGGSPVAFRAFSRLEGKVLYLGGVAIHRHYQGIGLYRQLIKCVVTDAEFLATRTQSPLVITTLRHLFGEVPPVTRQAYSNEQQIGWRLAKHLGMLGSYDKELMLGRGFYGHSLYRQPPVADASITERLYSLLDVGRGDCVIVVCPTK